jgi:hypothetical protein
MKAYTILVGKPKVRRPFRRSKHRLKDNLMQCSLLGIYWTTQCNIPGENGLHIHSCENIRANDIKMGREMVWKSMD